MGEAGAGQSDISVLQQPQLLVPALFITIPPLPALLQGGDSPRCSCCLHAKIHLVKTLLYGIGAGEEAVMGTWWLLSLLLSSAALHPGCGAPRLGRGQELSSGDTSPPPGLRESQRGAGDWRSTHKQLGDT